MNISKMPKVSVIIPVFNGERFIRKSIQSVLDQDYENLEVICVDDGSTDDTKGAIDEYFPRVTYVHQENRGPAAARNRGIRAASGDFIAFLDADDIWLPGKLARQMELVTRNVAAKIVHTNIRLTINGQTSDTIYPIDKQDGRMFESLLLHTGSVVCSTLLVKRECLDKVGLFDEELRTAEDVHLLLRLAYYYDFFYVNQALVMKVHHGGNLTSGTNPYFGAGTLLSLEKIEQIFPDCTRANSAVMRRGFYLRSRLIASSFEHKGDYAHAFRYLGKAAGYDPTPRNCLSVMKQALKLSFKYATSR